MKDAKLKHQKELGKLILANKKLKIETKTVKKQLPEGPEFTW